MKSKKRILLAIAAIAAALTISFFDDFSDKGRGRDDLSMPGENKGGQERVKSQAEGYFPVARVIDGDTIRLSDGRTIRYIGMDTPERKEPFYQKAKQRNAELVAGKAVRLKVCPENPSDKYGRTLAWVYADDVFVNEALLREGLARVLIIPPCGTPKAKEFRRIESEARQRKAGIWARGG
ncbi:MAG: thermonuclease family protein [Deltaproteobacteria bacterium]